MSESKYNIRGRALRIVVGLMMLGLLLAGGAGAVTPISSCTTISSSGSYVLTQNITNSSASKCISITASNVVFDGAGYTIDGVGAWDYSSGGVYVRNSVQVLTNVILKNLKVTDFYYAIYYENVTNGNIENNLVNSYLAGGIELVSSSGNTIENNTANSSSNYGIILSGSNNNTLINNRALNNHNGIYLSYSNNNTLIGNTADSNLLGISIWMSSNNTLLSNNANFNTNGLSIEWGSSNNTLYNNSMSGNRYNFIVDAGTYQSNISSDNLVDGKHVYYFKGVSDLIIDDASNTGILYCIECNNITLRNLTLMNNSVGISFYKTNNSKIENVITSNNRDYGIYLQYSNNTILRSNSAMNNGYNGILVSYSNKITLINNIARFNNYGIGLSYSNNSTLQGNIASENYAYMGGTGIRLDYSNNNTIRGNSAINNSDVGSYGSYGFYLSYSSYNTIIDNNASKNGGSYTSGVGIYLGSNSNNNTLINNTANNNKNLGITLSDSRNNMFRSNLMSYNRYNFGLSYWSDSDFSNNIDTSNLVDGKTIYYLISASGTIIDSSSNAGTVYCFKCENITLKDLYLKNNSNGIYLYNTSNSSIQGNKITDNNNGVYLSYSSNNNTIKRNKVSDNFYGIYITSSNNNTIVENFAGNNGYGFYLNPSNNNKIFHNNASNNNWGGFYLSSSSNNFIYQNNLINNTNNNASDYNGNNQWDNGTFGNYYSNYDQPSEGCADINSNDICDSKYTIPGGVSVDRYPLTKPWISILNIGSVHNINKGTNYTTIQAAINDASPGDEIHVDSGTYYENVNVTKRLTIRGIGMPFVNASGSGSAITLASDGIRLEGFTATGGGYYDAGIKVISNSNTLIGNNASSNNWYGIDLSASSNNMLSGNNASSNKLNGISLKSSSNNNTLIGNNVNLNNDGGISLGSSSNNTLIGNNANSNSGDWGIYLYSSSNNNTLNGNVVANSNLFGILLHSSSNNKIYHNNLINNTNQAYDNTGNNFWDFGYPSGGNYWSDYTGVDLNSGSNQNIQGSDGIGDTPYSISGGAGAQDRYPLMTPYIETPLPLVASITLPTNNFYSNESVNFSGTASGGVPPYNYTWTSNKVTEVLNTTTTESTSDKFNKTLAFNNETQEMNKHTINLTVTDSAGTPVTKTVELNVVKDVDDVYVVAVNFASYSSGSYPGDDISKNELENNAAKVTKFNLDSSYNSFYLNFKTPLDTITLKYSQAHYEEYKGKNEEQYKIIEEVNQKLKSSGIGYIPVVIVLNIKGEVMAPWTIMTEPDKGSIIDRPYIFVNRYNNYGKWAHEYGGITGGEVSNFPLPDLYPAGAEHGTVFWWDVMGSGPEVSIGAAPDKTYPVQHSSFSKLILGWLKPTEVIMGQEIILMPLEKNHYEGRAYIYKNSNSVSYIIEARDLPSGNFFSKNDACLTDDETLEDGVVIYKVEDFDLLGAMKPIKDNWKINSLYAPPGFKYYIVEYIEKKDDPTLFGSQTEYTDIPNFVTFKLVSVLNDLYYVPTVRIDPCDAACGSKKGVALDTTSTIGFAIGVSSSAYSNGNGTSPDLDLHAVTPEGLHIGMNYTSGEYEMQIPGGVTSGDLIGGEEWIFVPTGTEIRYYVDSHDVQQYLNENPSIDPANATMNYSITSMEYGENPRRVDLPDGNWTVTNRTVSEPQNDIIEPGVIKEIVPEPPASITNMTFEAGSTWLNFTWLNPSDPDFNHTELYLNGTFLTNVMAPQNYYHITGLITDTEYELGTHTVDTAGNINQTWVNRTARTVSEEIHVTNPSTNPAIILNDNGRPRLPGTNITRLNVTVIGNVASVSIDLSPIGGLEAAPMTKISGTDIYTTTTNATSGINLTHYLVVTATDPIGNFTNSVSIPLTVLLRGDIVRDNKIDLKDLLYMRRHLAGLEPSINPVVADIQPDKGDGYIDLKDLLYLRRYLAGLEPSI